MRRLLVLLISVPVAVQAQWTSYRGDALQSGVAREVLAPPLRLNWQIDAGDSVEATAVVSGKTVYVATMGGKLMALDLDTGKTRWSFKSLSAFNSSPLLHGGMLFVGGQRRLVLRHRR